ncbi:hypothetical protein [Limisphaera sp. 4302-co]|uniref:hypothetical protein n=1 Tax=Limisphaera sp. 4302-co TaxID=3400417 RepID=UPI003C1F5563
MTMKATNRIARWLVSTGALVGTAALLQAQGITPEIQAKIDAKIKQIQTWAADEVIVQAVREHNANPSPEAKAMTQEKWKTLPVLDPFVRSFTKHAATERLKAKKDDTVTEAFISGADGTKVAFLSKPSNWSHKGKDKHEVPMSGKTWQGEPEVDESTGLQQVQVAVPVLDGGKPIGSLVVGLSLNKLGS